MLRHAASRLLQKTAHRAAVPLSLLAILVLALLPEVDLRTIYLSENNLKVVVESSIALRDTLTLPWNTSCPLPTQFRVQGRRSSGSYAVAIVVNADRPASVAVAAAIASRYLRDGNGLAGDIHFSFFSDVAQNGAKVPHSHTFEGARRGLHSSSFSRAVRQHLPNRHDVWGYVPSDVEAAVVLNITSTAHTGGSSLCVKAFGPNGVPPNLDLVNILVLRGAAMGLDVNPLCWLEEDDKEEEMLLGRGGGALSVVNVLGKLFGPVRGFIGRKLSMVSLVYWRALLRVAKVHGAPADGGGPLRLRGTHPLVLSSLSTSTHLGGTGDDTVAIAKLVDVFLRSVNHLEERLHHSFPLYVSVSPRHFVDFEAAQVAVFVSLAALASGLLRSLRQCDSGVLQGAAVRNAGRNVLGASIVWIASWGCCVAPALAARSTHIMTSSLGTDNEKYRDSYSFLELWCTVAPLASSGVVVAVAVLLLLQVLKGTEIALLGLSHMVVVCFVFAVHPLLSLTASVATALVYALLSVSPVASLVAGLLYGWWWWLSLSGPFLNSWECPLIGGTLDGLLLPYSLFEYAPAHVLVVFTVLPNILHAAYLSIARHCFPRLAPL